MIADEIESLGRVHFDLNSSGLNNNARSVLRGLASIMEKYPELELEISSHADSRGAAKYNEWLSQKRVDRTLGFLRGLGVPSERVKGTAFGESPLLNECDDHTHCPEEKHRVNRRSEFNILKF